MASRYESLAGPALDPGRLPADWPFAASNLRLLDAVLDYSRPEHHNLVQGLQRKKKFLYGSPEGYRNPHLSFHVTDAARQERYRLPVHVFPVVLPRQGWVGDKVLGAIIPYEPTRLDPGDWNVAYVCEALGVGDTPRQWLHSLLAVLERAWKKPPLPLRSRCGIDIQLGVSVPPDQIEGRSFELPLALAVLRECCYQQIGQRPFGDGPVFCSATITGFDGHLGKVDGLEWKLDAFLRECGNGHAALLLKSQMAILSYLRAGFEGTFREIHQIESLSSLMELPAFRSGLEQIAAAPSEEEATRLWHWVGAHETEAAVTSLYLHHHGRFGPRDEKGELREAKLREWSEAVTRDRLENLTGYKYLPECYMERGGLDDRVRFWLSSGRTPALLVAAPAGTGKTSLLCRVADGSLSNDPLLTVHLIVGGQSETPKGPEPLMRRLRQDFELKDESFLELLEAWRRANPDRKLLMVIDAVNEAAEPQVLLEDLVNLARVARHVAGAEGAPWARVIASIRIESLLALQGRGAELDARLFADFTPPKGEEDWHRPLERDKPKLYLELQPFGESEAKAAYEKYAATEAAHCLARWESLPEQTRLLLRQPILVRLFHDLNAGKAMPDPIATGHELWLRYLARAFRTRRYLEKATFLLGELCLNKGAAEPTRELMGQFLNRWREETELDYALPVRDTAEVLQHLVEEGLLRKDVGGGWKWSSDLLAEQIFFQVLTAEDPDYQDESIQKWCEGLPEMPRRNAALALVGTRLWTNERFVSMRLLAFPDVLSRTFSLLVPDLDRPLEEQLRQFEEAAATIGPALDRIILNSAPWYWRALEIARLQLAADPDNLLLSRNLLFVDVRLGELENSGNYGTLLGWPGYDDRAVVERLSSTSPGESSLGVLEN